MAELKGQAIVVTRPRAQAAPLVRLLADRGARVIERPTIAVNLRRDAVTMQRLAGIGKSSCDAILVTSGNAARALAEYATPAARQVLVYAVGSATAEALRRQGFTDVRVGRTASGESLLAHITQEHGKHLAAMRFVAPQSSRASDVLVDGLTSARADVDIIVAYDTVPVLDGPQLPTGRIDWVTFTSPSAVDGFVRALPVPKGARIACLGPTTRSAAHDAGLDVHVMPGAPSLAALVDAMAADP